MEHLTIRANGAAFHVSKTGTGKPLLLLHGWPEFWLTWEPAMARLADRLIEVGPPYATKIGGPVPLHCNSGREGRLRRSA
jgi:hypothetical protein